MDEPVKLMIACAIYARHRDLGRITGDLTNSICTAINSVTPGEAVGAQLIRGVWYIYVKNEHTRVSLLRLGKLLIQKTPLYLFAENPYAMVPRVPNERVVIRDLPLFESDDQIYNFLSENPQIKPVGRVNFSKCRNTTFVNGDRFVYVRGNFSPPLPRIIQLGDHTCRLWHASQSISCQRCKQSTHPTLDTVNCPAYVSSQDNVTPFRQPQNVLSNFYPCKLVYDGKSFRNSEAAYLWSKCIDLLEPDLAEKIFNAKSAPEAKQISREIPESTDHSEWDKRKFLVMKNVLRAKLEHCSLYRDVLTKSGTDVLVEATKDDFWGAGMPPQMVTTTAPSYWHGKNNLGKLHMEIRAELDHANMQSLKSPIPSSVEPQPESSTKSVQPTSNTVPVLQLHNSQGLRDNLNKPLNPDTELVHVNDSVDPTKSKIKPVKSVKRAGRSLQRSVQQRSNSLPPLLNSKRIRNDTRLISGFLSNPTIDVKSKKTIKKIASSTTPSSIPSIQPTPSAAAPLNPMSTAPVDHVSTAMDTTSISDSTPPVLI